MGVLSFKNTQFCTVIEIRIHKFRILQIPVLFHVMAPRYSRVKVESIPNTKKDRFVYDRRQMRVTTKFVNGFVTFFYVVLYFSP